MNMKKIVSLFFTLLLSVSYSVGQGKANLLNAKTVSQIGLKSKEQIKADHFSGSTKAQALRLSPHVAPD